MTKREPALTTRLPVPIRPLRSSRSVTQNDERSVFATVGACHAREGREVSCLVGYRHVVRVSGDVLVHRRRHPPIDPSDTAAQVAARYTQDGLRIRIGLALMIFFAFAWTPFWALLARQVRRIEGYRGVMSLTQILLGVTFPFGFSLCAIFAVTAGYRPERNPDVTQALNDVFWFIFVGLVGADHSGRDPCVRRPVRRQAPGAELSALVRLLQHLVRGFRGAWLRRLLVQDRTVGVEWDLRLLDPLTVFCIWQVIASVMLAKAVDVEAAERDKAAAEQIREPAA